MEQSFDPLPRGSIDARGGFTTMIYVVGLIVLGLCAWGWVQWRFDPAGFTVWWELFRVSVKNQRILATLLAGSAVAAALGFLVLGLPHDPGSRVGAIQERVWATSWMSTLAFCLSYYAALTALIVMIGSTGGWDESPFRDFFVVFSACSVALASSRGTQFAMLAMCVSVAWLVPVVGARLPISWDRLLVSMFLVFLPTLIALVARVSLESQARRVVEARS